jgi:hypothetical protein
MEAKLYVILGSHACRTGILMMEHKRIDYELVELPTGLHPFLLRLRGFTGNPAPFRRVDDRAPRMLRRADRMGDGAGAARRWSAGEDQSRDRPLPRPAPA